MIHAECLVAEFVSIEKARVALEVLRLDDFASDAVSIAWQGHDKPISPAERIGNTLQTYLTTSDLKIPVTIVGPLSSLIGSAITGGLFGMAGGWGIPEVAAMRYDQLIANDAVLVVVTSTPHRLDEAKAVLKTCGPKSLERFGKRHDLTRREIEPSIKEPHA